MCVCGAATYFVFSGHLDICWSFNLSLSLSLSFNGHNMVRLKPESEIFKKCDQEWPICEVKPVLLDKGGLLAISVLVYPKGVC